MPATPNEYQTVQARLLAYAPEIGWTYVPRGEAERRRGFAPSKATPGEQAAEASPYFDDLLDAQVRKLNPKYAEGPGALVGDLRRLHADSAGNRDFLAFPRQGSIREAMQDASAAFQRIVRERGQVHFFAEMIRRQ